MKSLCRGIVVCGLFVVLGEAVPSPAIAQSSPRGPDILGLRRLTAKLVQRTADPSRHVDPAVGIFLAPVADDVDRISDGKSEVVEQAESWLAEYAKHQVLFRRSDITRLQREIIALPPVAVGRWLESSELLRARLMDEPWQETERWLRTFFAVQAIYAEQELDSFRGQLAALTADELMEVLDHFEGVRAARMRGQLANEQQRQEALNSNREMRSSQNWRGSAMAVRTPSSFPSFAQSRSPSVARRQNYVVNRSRDLSLSVARMYMWNGYYGGGWFWYGAFLP